jgi:raffinose synthase
MPQTQESLVISGRRVLSGPADGVCARALGDGSFLSYLGSPASARFAVRLGKLVGARRFVALFRADPFWLQPRAVRTVGEVPVGTELLLAELEGGDVLLVAPLVQAPFVVTLEGRGEELFAVADTGDPALLGGEVLLAYAAVDADVFCLVRSGARAVAAELGTVSLRRDREPPDFASGLGWCTWDAFYHDVSLEHVRAGLTSFRDGGIPPGFMILDDGWQCAVTTPTGEKRLTALEANVKFQGGISALVQLAKRDFGVQRVLVWHALHGYWGGLDADRFPAYCVTNTARSYPDELRFHRPEVDSEWFGHWVGVPHPARLPAFFEDLHSELAAAGVDGVKIDNQASLEGLSSAVGGRVEAVRAAREALNASVERHFSGRSVACMACASPLLYHESAGFTRTSNDFWPDRPESHGAHGYTNALVSLWFGEFVWPDWDMFQSGHVAGAYHAALRVVSGGPIYVSDKPGVHDFDLLAQLTLSCGSVLRADDIGVPTRDCLFEPVTQEPVLLKIWNRNSTSGLLGVFHAQAAQTPITGMLAAADVPGLLGDDFVLFFRCAGRAVRTPRERLHWLTLPPLGWEMVSVVPVDRGVAVLGLADKLNGSAAITERGWIGDGYAFTLRDGGECVAWCAERPSAVTIDGEPVAYLYTESILRVAVPRGASRKLVISVPAASTRGDDEDP